jgi:uncharacterized membrane protein
MRVHSGTISMIGLFLGMVAYPWLVYQTLSGPQEQRAGYSLASAALLLLIVTLLSTKSRYRLPALGICLALGFFFYSNPTWLISNIAWLYLLEYSTFNCLLCFGFARTLAVGRTPMITQFATLIRNAATPAIEVTPAITVYTRAVTWAWVLFFGVLILISLMLFLLGSYQSWSLFATALTPILVLVMFAGEYIIRLRLLPQEKHEGIIAMLRALCSRS